MLVGYARALARAQGDAAAAGRTQGALRFSLGPTNTEAEVDRVLEVLPGLVDKLRSLTRMPVSR